MVGYFAASILTGNLNKDTVDEIKDSISDGLSSGNIPKAGAMLLVGRDDASWSCWKPILHSLSEPDAPVYLNDLIRHGIVRKYDHTENIAENIYGETFEIVRVHSNFMHAIQL